MNAYQVATNKEFAVAAMQEAIELIAAKNGFNCRCFDGSNANKSRLASCSCKADFKVSRTDSGQSQMRLAYGVDALGWCFVVDDDRDPHKAISVRLTQFQAKALIDRLERKYKKSLTR